MGFSPLAGGARGHPRSQRERTPSSAGEWGNGSGKVDAARTHGGM